MERVLDIGERLQKLLEDAEREAERNVAEAQKRADEMISRAKEEAETRRHRAQRGDGIEDLTRGEEEKAKEEAAKILDGYRVKAEAIKKVSSARLEEALKLVLREVLPR